MREKFVVTIRFHTEGAEAELYQRILAEKRKVGRSMPEYLKQVLQEYFSDKDRKDLQEERWEQRREEYQEMLAGIERLVRTCLNEHDAAVMGMLAKMVAGAAGTEVLPTGRVEVRTEMAGEEGMEAERERIEEAALPEESEEVPEGVLDFLAEF